VLQCVAVCCSVLQCVAVYCSYVAVAVCLEIDMYTYIYIQTHVCIHTRWAYHAKISSWYTLHNSSSPRNGTAYHDDILLKITPAWYSSLAWYTLCAENLTVLEKSVEPFFVLLDAYLHLKPSWLVCAPNVLFIAFAPNFSFIQAFKRQVAKNRARCSALDF